MSKISWFPFQPSLPEENNDSNLGLALSVSTDMLSSMCPKADLYSCRSRQTRGYDTITQRKRQL